MFCLSLKSVEPWEIKQTCGFSAPHTTHCLGSDDIMISCLGDANGDAKGKAAIFKLKT